MLLTGRKMILAKKDLRHDTAAAYNEGIARTLLAFANTEGGTLYVGVDEDGTILGLDKAQAVANRIREDVRKGICPDLSAFVACSVIEIDDRSIVQVRVERGMRRPYFLSSLGLCATGVLVRAGSANVPTDEQEIRRMLVESGGPDVESRVSFKQNLTFHEAAAFFAEKGIFFDLPQMKALKVINSDGLYTVLGRLISDQCEHTIKIVVFKDSEKSSILERAEFSGSLLKQLQDASVYLNAKNLLRSGPDEFEFEDLRDYPPSAVQEGLTNALVHRDYDVNGSVLVNLLSNRLEFVSPGGITSGLTLEDVRFGVSAMRNPGLAAIFEKLELAVGFGTGLSAIVSSYKKSGLAPEISASPNAFKLTLPNRNERPDNLRISERATPLLQIPEKIDEREQKVLDFATSQPVISRQEVQKLLGTSQTTTLVLLKKLTDLNLLRKVGATRNIRYELVR